MSKANERRGRAWLAVLCAGALALGLVAAPSAQADPDDPIFIFDPGKLPQDPPPRFPGFEGPCGLAVDSVGNVYVSDYHHHLIDVLALEKMPPFITNIKNVDPLDGPCGLALGATGTLFVNSFHRNVEKFVPSSFPPDAGSSFPVMIPATSYASQGIVDANHPTGVAVDQTTDTLYVNARTQIDAYDATTGIPLATIGAPSLDDAYGLAVSGFPATAGYLYVPDDASDTVKVYDPSVDVEDPVAVIDGAETPSGEFLSLDDSAVAVDDTTGEIYVADTRGPQYSETPEATIHVFDSSGAYEGRLKHDIVDAIPPGLAVDNSPTATQGRVYVTSGNSEGAVIYAYPPGAATSGPAPLGTLDAGTRPEAAPPLGAATTAAGGVGAAGPTASGSEIAQKGTLRLTVNGRLAPQRLPRQGAAPIAVSVGGQITTTDRSPPPQLKTLEIELNREGRLDYAGLPTCRYEAIQPASTSRALSACRSALVGRGSFTAQITLGGQDPYPTQGTMLLFNGKEDGKQVLFGQIYAPRPFATSFVIVFAIERLGKGTYATVLKASLPEALGSWGNLTGIEMTLKRTYVHQGRQHSYISAGCPAPKGFPGAVFPLARTSFGFAGGKQLSSVLSGSCKVRG